MPPPLAIAHYAGPLWISIAYLLLYYALVINVRRVKVKLARAHEGRPEVFDRYESKDPQMLAADRVMLNTLEHMPPFLTMLWLSAVFIGTPDVTVAGTVYVAARGVYPFLVGPRLSRKVPKRVLLATYTGYGVLTYFAVKLVVALLS